MTRSMTTTGWWIVLGVYAAGVATIVALWRRAHVEGHDREWYLCLMFALLWPLWLASVAIGG